MLPKYTDPQRLIYKANRQPRTAWPPTAEESVQQPPEKKKAGGTCVIAEMLVREVWKIESDKIREKTRLIKAED